MNKIIVIGGGAAGLLAGGTAISQGAEVTIIDKNEKPARKLMITGKGRCNVTNNCNEITELIKNVAHNPRFLYSAFTEFMPSDTMKLFEELGVPLKTERGNRVFPVSDKAGDIVDALKKYTRNTKYVSATVKKIIAENNHITGVLLDNGDVLSADKYILATGGKSYHLTGSSGDGYRFSEELGHTVIPLKPSLVPLVTKEGWCAKLQGLSLKNVTFSLYEDGKKKPVYSELGEMLFTHFGVSGPLVLSASSHIKNLSSKKYVGIIDLKPALSLEQLNKRLIRDFSDNINKDFGNSLTGLLPHKLIPVFIRLSGIDADKKVNQITKPEREKIAELLKNLKITISDFHSFDEAIITSGGVSVKEINPKTMASKIIDNLYFAGEVIDVDAYTGGYNLQIAFATGYVAGKSSTEGIHYE